MTDKTLTRAALTLLLLPDSDLAPPGSLDTLVTLGLARRQGQFWWLTERGEAVREMAEHSLFYDLPLLSR